MSENHTSYLTDAANVRVRPLTRRELNAIARDARIRGLSMQEAEASFRAFCAYWEGSASASIGRSVARGDVKTVVAR